MQNMGSDTQTHRLGIRQHLGACTRIASRASRLGKESKSNHPRSLRSLVAAPEEVFRDVCMYVCMVETRMADRHEDALGYLDSLHSCPVQGQIFGSWGGRKGWVHGRMRNHFDRGGLEG